MTEVRAVVLSLLVVVGVLAAVAPGSVAMAGGGEPLATEAGTAADTEAAGDSAAAADSGATGESETASASNNSSMGDQMTSFMQSTTGETGEEVESGMWNAAYANAADGSSKSRVVERRTEDISARLAELRRQKADLVAARENDTISDAEYRARMSRLVGRMAALNRSIEQTEAQANASGANESAVLRLREEASELSGPEVAEVARSIPGGNPGMGPAADTPGQGAPGNETGTPGNGNGPPGNETGPPDEETGPPANETSTPDDSNGDGPAGNETGDPGGPPADDPPGEGPPEDDPHGGGPPGTDEAAKPG